MKINSDRRGVLKLGLAATASTHASVALSQQAEISLDTETIFPIGLFKDLVKIKIPPKIKSIKTSGFWKDGTGGQILDRVVPPPKHILWPRYVRTADGAVWACRDFSATADIFGETADGNYHALSERFVTLDQTREVYPFATSLKQSIDWAANQTLAFFSVGAKGCILPGMRVITDPIRVPARAQLIGMSCSPDILCFTASDASGGFAKGRGVFESFDYWNIENPNYWHWSSIRQIAIDGASIADHGVSLWCMGEHSLLEDICVRSCRTVNIFIGGYGAVGTLRNCSVWRSGRVGLAFSNHPLPGFPKTSEIAVAGNGNGGSYRINNLSGDDNPIHIEATGTQIVELDGLKTERCPVVISVSGNAVGPGRQRWNIGGFRAEGGTVGRSFISVAAGAKPSITLEAGATYNFPNIIEDRNFNPIHVVSSYQAGITFLAYGKDSSDAVCLDVSKLSFFGVTPLSRGVIPGALNLQSSEADRDRLINALRDLLIGYGLAK